MVSSNLLSCLYLASAFTVSVCLSLSIFFPSHSYAQAAISAIESQYIRKTGKKLELSPQHLVDCTLTGRVADPTLANQGCVGGWTRKVFEYLKTTGTCTAEE